jgi:hypothetical protein
MSTVYTSVSTLAEINRGNSRAKVQGVIYSNALTADTVTTIDWAFPQERWLTGGSISISGNWGSHFTVQIVDVDNVLGAGAGYVAEEFITQYYVVEGATTQLSKEFNYPALIPAGLYIRLLYTNTHASIPATVVMNIFSHIPKV